MNPHCSHAGRCHDVSERGKDRDAAALEILRPEHGDEWFVDLGHGEPVKLRVEQVPASRLYDAGPLERHEVLVTGCDGDWERIGGPCIPWARILRAIAKGAAQPAQEAA